MLLVGFQSSRFWVVVECTNIPFIHIGWYGKYITCNKLRHISNKWILVVWVTRVSFCRDICKLADKYNAMVFIDECHGTGFFGPTGR